jgi:hypothetical protein
MCGHSFVIQIPAYFLPYSSYGTAYFFIPIIIQDFVSMCSITGKGCTGQQQLELMPRQWLLHSNCQVGNLPCLKQEPAKHHGKSGHPATLRDYWSLFQQHQDERQTHI